MPLRVAINGFGRIGRSALRAARNRGAAIEIVAVNDLADSATMAHLPRYDSLRGPYPGKVPPTDRGVEVDGEELLLLAQRDPRDLPPAVSISCSRSWRPQPSPGDAAASRRLRR
jgi:glyceraldehyde 3-phosphate dehydrogenase